MTPPPPNPFPSPSLPFLGIPLLAAILTVVALVFVFAVVLGRRIVALIRLGVRLWQSLPTLVSGLRDAAGALDTLSQVFANINSTGVLQQCGQTMQTAATDLSAVTVPDINIPSTSFWNALRAALAPTLSLPDTPPPGVGNLSVLQSTSLGLQTTPFSSASADLSAAGSALGDVASRTQTDLSDAASALRAVASALELLETPALP